VLRSNPWHYSLPLAFALLVFVGRIVYINYFSALRAAPLTDSPSAAAAGPFTPR
jgi:hypothetical protein